MGLSIVKKIVELQGGTVAIDSQEGQGTTMIVDLDLPEAPAEGSDTPPKPPIFERIRRVLVGEDDPMSRQVLHQLLHRGGLEPVVVATGHEVLQEAQKQLYDLLIVDYHMPGLNGNEVISRLPKDYPAAIIMLSGEDPPPPLPSSLQPLVFLKKPVDPTALLQEIRTLDRRPSEIDLSYLREITDGNPQLMIDLIDTFIYQVPQEIKRMKTAVKQEDWSALYLAVHKSKPNFSYVGVHSIQESLNRFEAEVQQQTNQEAYPQYIRELGEFTRRIIPELEAQKQNVWRPE